MACQFFSKCDVGGMRWSRLRDHVAVLLALMACLGTGVAMSQVSAPVSAVREASAAASVASAGAAASAPKGAASATEPGLAGLRSSADKIQFNQQQLGSTSVVKSITVAADPAASATATFEVHASGDFTVAPTRCEIPAKGSCALSVSFAPTKTGETSSAIVVSTAHGGPTRVIAELTAQGIDLCQARGLFPCTPWWAVAPVGFLALWYWVAVIITRWNRVARPTRELLRAEIEAVKVRLAGLVCTGSAPQACHAQVTALLDLASKCLHQGSGLNWLLAVVFWSRGEEQAGWQLLHEAKEQIAPLLPPEELRVALEDAEVQLRQAAITETLALADHIHTELTHTVLDVADRPAALMRETLAFVTAAASDVAADVAAMQEAKSSANSADMATLSARLVTALAPGAALSAPIKLALTAAMPWEYQLVLEHASTVFLPEARRMHDNFNALPVGTDATTLREDLHRCLDAFQKQFLPHAEVLRQRLELALESAPQPQSQRRASLLSEARNQLYDSSDTEFASIASWHKKTAWLVGSSLLLVVVLSATFGNATFFLLGALGGLMSRLSRVLVRQQVPTDYGFSWTTLFLSPMVGALAGWSGMLLLALAVKYQVLGELFASVKWTNPQSELAMGLALLLGTSEKMFVKIVEGVEGKMGVGGAADAAAGAVKSPNPTANATPKGTTPVAKSKATTVTSPAVKSASQAEPKHAQALLSRRSHGH